MQRAVVAAGISLMVESPDILLDIAQGDPLSNAAVEELR